MILIAWILTASPTESSHHPRQEERSCELDFLQHKAVRSRYRCWSIAGNEASKSNLVDRGLMQSTVPKRCSWIALENHRRARKKQSRAEISALMLSGKGVGISSPSIYSLALRAPQYTCPIILPTKSRNLYDITICKLHHVVDLPKYNHPHHSFRRLFCAFLVYLGGPRGRDLTA